MRVKSRPLGRTGLSISEIGFGCGPTAGLMIAGTPAGRRQAIARALELGIDYFDTAPIYGDTASEANLGRALSELDARPVVATKVALNLADLGDIRGAVIRSVEASLERLGMKRVALVQLHNRVGERRAPKPDIGTGALLTVDDVLGKNGVVAALNSLRERGMVDFFGCCAFGGEVAAVNRLIDSGAFAAILVHYSVLNPTAWLAAPGAGLRSYGQAGARAAAAGMGAIALRVLEAGALAKDDGRHPPADGTTPAETAIRFALSNPEIATALVGFSDIDQIEAAVHYAEKGVLPASSLARLAAWHETD